MNGQKMPEYLNAAYEGDDLFTGDQLRVAVAAEREACAKLVEDSWMAFSRAPNVRLEITPFPELSYVAKVIRART